MADDLKYKIGDRVHIDTTWAMSPYHIGTIVGISGNTIWPYFVQPDCGACKRMCSEREILFYTDPYSKVYEGLKLWLTI